MEYNDSNLKDEIIKNSKLKTCINKYDELLETYGSELNNIKNNINEALFNEYLITIKSRINKQTSIVRIVQKDNRNSYFIPIFTDEFEYIKGIETFEFEEEIIDEPYITTIHEFIDIAKNDPNLKGLIVNPHNQDFAIDMDSVLEYDEK
ncbi:MAG: hypothetical protein Q4P18_08095 [Methanobrevibacter sp.]|uniref:hypothetical protein n=1 Tax=Methanobrevibacter sp. TaxID=66852 RepID=UPI0026DF065C|nr:hypothetical protein [Methanobrevibacter sp.]MDO5849482.1 hypothetical protein [Methanobrevibacter sp.]